MLTSTSKHALRALIYLVDCEQDRFIAVGELAKKTGVPPTYLPKIFKLLAARGIVTAKRGTGGGVQLAKKSFSFLDVCAALKDPILTEDCFLSDKKCRLDDPCPLHSAWSKERKRLHRLLKNSIFHAPRSGVSCWNLTIQWGK